MDWFLLRVAPQRQGRYVDYMGEFCPDVEIYFPVYKRVTRPNGVRRPVVSMVPVFPGYVFGRTQGNLYRMVGGMVPARFVRFGGEMGVVRSSVIEELRRLECTGKLVETVQKVNPYRVGVKVRVHHPVGDLVGVIVKMAGVHRVHIDIDKYRAVVPISCLELCTDVQ